MAHRVDRLVLTLFISCVILGSHLTSLCLGVKWKPQEKLIRFVKSERDEKYLEYVCYVVISQ